MVKNCCVKGCNSESYANCGISFHRFPKDELLFAKWVNALGCEITSKNPTVCSRHFKKEDFRPTVLPTLKKDAVPLVVLPNDMENYIQHRVMDSVSQVRLKKGCMPTKFECQSDETKLTTTKRPCNVKKQKMLIEDLKKELEEKNVHKSPPEIGQPSSSTSSDNTQPDYRRGNKKRLRLSARRKKRKGPTKKRTAATKNMELEESLLRSSDLTVDATTSSGVSQVIEEDVSVALTLQTSYDVPVDVDESCHSSSTESAKSGPDDTLNFITSENTQNSVADESMNYSIYRFKCNTIIANVYHYLQQEYVSLKGQLGGLCDVSALSNTLARTAAATGVSQDEVEIALREAALHSDQTSKPEETYSSAGVSRPRIIRRNKLCSKTLASSDTSTTEVQTITWRKKTNAQRCREYRERNKLQNTMEQSDIKNGSEPDQLPAKRPKTNAERRKKHYEAQKLKKQESKKIPKTVKQKNKEYYERKKKIRALNTLYHHSDAEDKSDNSVRPSKRKATSKSVASKSIDEEQLPFPAPIQLRVLGVETECKIEPVDELPMMCDPLDAESSSHCGTSEETEMEIKTEPVDDESLQNIKDDPLALEWTPTALQKPLDPPDRFTKVKSEHVDHDYAGMCWDPSAYDKKRPDIEPKLPSQ